MTRSVKFDPQEQLLKGISILTRAVASTLGPKGRNVIIQTPYGATTVTKDGVTVAKVVELKHPIQNLGAQIVKQASEKTARTAGDGPQPLYSKILTPTGFVPMGNLKVGDLICGTNGSIQTILGVFPKGEKEIFEVKFSDGRIVECCEDHLWAVTTNYGNSKVLPLSEIIKSGKIASLNVDGSYTHNFYVPTTYVDFQTSNITIDPYLLGVLLGDGSLSGTGEVEISLGMNKEYIINKLDKSLIKSVNFIPEKNYFRVKLHQTTLVEQLKALGLYGVTSASKFIPKNYLYNSLLCREQLLQGLLDTDGHINPRGLFEFSTISEQLSNDFLELTRGLGMSVTHRLHVRDLDPNSYSDTPIHRIWQRKGYKYGNKLVEVRATGKQTPMQCISVSNADNLYVTDNYIVTHNTTTSVILANAIIQEALKLTATGIPATDIKRAIERYKPTLLAELESYSSPVDMDDIKNIATISANNDETIGNLIHTAYQHIGREGIITIEDSPTATTTVELVDGVKLERGYVSPFFVTDPVKEEAVLEDALVLITDKKIRTPEDIYPYMHHAASEGKSLLIIGDEIEAQALQVMILNKLNQRIKIAAIKAPSYGTNRGELLRDIAALTSATVISEAKGHRLETSLLDHLGYAGKVVISSTNTVIINGKQNPAEVQDRADKIRTQLETTTEEYFHNKLLERLASLTAKVALIRVGAPTETEQKEQKDRIDDALRATRSALSKGYLPGGATSLLRLHKSVPADLLLQPLKQALLAPLKTLTENAGVSFEVAFDKITSQKSNSYGFNAHTMEYSDLKNDGVLDATLVVYEALSNAISAANMILLSSTAIYSDTPVPTAPEM